MMAVSTYNKYDAYLFLLITALVCGNLGGALQVSRMLAIVLFPFLINLLGKETDTYLINIRKFCMFWVLYNIISLVWTSNFYNGLKECVYYVVHFIYFLEVIEFSREAFQAKRSISVGWMVGLSISLIIAIWEIKTDNHLSVSKYGEAIAMNMGGTIVLHNFASVTFGNYNGYVVYLCMCVPFLFYFLNENRFFYYVVLIVSLTACIYVLFTNGSRGGILTFSIFLCYFFVSSMRRGNISLIATGAIFVALMFFIIYFWNSFSSFFLARVSGGVNDQGRWEIWGRSMRVFISSYGFGSGVGSIVESLRRISFTGDILICHNAFLELLVQYGIFIFIPCMCFLWGIFKRTRYVDDINAKMIVFGSFLIMLPLFIIDSGIILLPHFWAFISSLVVFTEIDYRNIVVV